MRGGNNRRTARQKRTAGTQRRDRQRKTQIPVVKDVDGIAPPFWLKGMALQKWREIAGRLATLGVFTEMDVDIVADTAQHWAIMVDAKNEVERIGIAVKNAKGRWVKHPMLQVYREESKAFRECLGRLGMTPADRGRIDAADSDDKDDAFFNRPQTVTG